jgi:hypothetical protein
MAFQSGIPFGTQRDSKDAAQARLGPRTPTVGGASVSVGAGAKAAAKKHQQKAMSESSSPFSEARAAAPGPVEAWRAKAFGNRAFAEDFMPPGGDPQPDTVAKKSTSSEGTA